MKDKLIEKQKELIQAYKISDWINVGRLGDEIMALESDLAKEEPEHDTCDGCQMFQDCGCMLDVSICPDCVEHNMWTPREPDELTIQDFKDKYGLVYDDIETAIRNYVNGKQEPMVAKDQYDYPLTTANNHVEIKEQEPEGVTVEEILKDEQSTYTWNLICKTPVAYGSDIMLKDWIVQAMESYASSKQIDKRKFLKDFNSWMCDKQYDGRIPLIDTCITEYLNNL